MPRQQPTRKQRENAAKAIGDLFTGIGRAIMSAARKEDRGRVLNLVLGAADGSAEEPANDIESAARIYNELDQTERDALLKTADAIRAMYDEYEQFGETKGRWLSVDPLTDKLHVWVRQRKVQHMCRPSIGVACDCHDLAGGVENCLVCLPLANMQRPQADES